MSTEFRQTENTYAYKKQTSSIPFILTLGAIALGMILWTFALIMWPISVLEGWNGDPLFTIMVVCSFLLLFAACHYFDCEDERKRRDSSKFS